MLLDQVDQRVAVEALHRDDRRAVGQAHVEDDRLAVDVEEGQQADERVLLGEGHRVVGLLDVRDQVAVGEHHALHQAGGAARVGQHGELLGIDLDRLGRGAGLDPRDEAHGIVDEHLRPRVLLLAAHLLLREQRVHRRDHSARAQDPVVDDAPLRAVRADQGDHVAPADPVRLERCGDGVDLRRELGVGGRFAGGGIDEGRVIAARGRLAEHVLGHGEIRDLDVRLGAAVDQSFTPRQPA